MTFILLGPGGPWADTAHGQTDPAQQEARRRRIERDIEQKYRELDQARLALTQQQAHLDDARTQVMNLTGQMQIAQQRQTDAQARQIPARQMRDQAKLRFDDRDRQLKQHRGDLQTLIAARKATHAQTPEMVKAISASDAARQTVEQANADVLAQLATEPEYIEAHQGVEAAKKRLAELREHGPEVTAERIAVSNDMLEHDGKLNRMRIAALASAPSIKQAEAELTATELHLANLWDLFDQQLQQTAEVITAKVAVDAIEQEHTQARQTLDQAAARLTEADAELQAATAIVTRGNAMLQQANRAVATAQGNVTQATARIEFIERQIRDLHRQLRNIR